ncbi:MULTISPECIES: hypothetical protein [Enterococcus]|nr:MULTISPECIES: hypothetical protein [unclassified Enterococcus]OTO70402.1 hypothetical protein A5866_002624 [Enterococcus sp. 12C11_DIV0727]
MQKFIKTVFKVLRPLFLLGLLAVFGFFLIYVVKELIEERNLAGIPTILCLFLLAIILQVIKSWFSQK